MTVTVTGGIVSAGAQLAQFEGDGARLNVHLSGGLEFFATLDLEQTVTAVSPMACRSENDPTGLDAYLTQAQVLEVDEQPGIFFNFQVDRFAAR